MTTYIVIWLFCGVIAAAISHIHNRGAAQGFLWGALLGVIGVIVVLCLPAKTNPALPAPPGWYADPAGTGGHRYWDGRLWSDCDAQKGNDYAMQQAYPGMSGSIQVECDYAPDGDHHDVNCLRTVPYNYYPNGVQGRAL